MTDKINQCGPCQRKAGGKMEEETAITICMGDCPTCGEKGVAIVPWRDYTWPDGTKAWFD